MFFKICINCDELIDNNPACDDLCSKDCESIYYDKQDENERGENK